MSRTAQDASVSSGSSGGERKKVSKEQDSRQRFVVEEVEEEKTESNQSEPGQKTSDASKPDFQSKRAEPQHIHTHTVQSSDTAVETRGQEQRFTDDFSLPDRSASGAKRIIMIIVTVLILGTAIGGGFLVFSRFVANKSKIAVPTPTPTPKVKVITPTATPTPTLPPLSSYKIQVLNGSGKRGEANKVAKLLKEAGFGAASAANASSFNHTKTTVQMKENIPDTVFEKVKELLSDREVVKEENLPDDSSYDIVITIGSTVSSTDVSGE